MNRNEKPGGRKLEGGVRSIWSKGAVVSGCEHEASEPHNRMMAKTRESSNKTDREQSTRGCEVSVLGQEESSREP